jgi:phage terminase Nu1 subunit (DNA packaging protein)
LSKQRAADLADKQQDDEVRRSIKKSNLTRQQEFKKIKKNQKKTGLLIFNCFFFYLQFYLIRKIYGKSNQCT